MIQRPEIIRLMSRPLLPNIELRPEDYLSSQVADAMRRHTLDGTYKGVWCTIPNGGRSQLHSSVLKLCGSITGAPDMMFMWPEVDELSFRLGCGLVELKCEAGVRMTRKGPKATKRGSLSKEQKDFRAWAVNAGIPWTIARSVGEVEGFLREHGGLE